MIVPRLDQWYTVKETAELLRVHPQTVRRWLREGKLAGSFISRRGGWRVRGTALRTFLRERENGH